MKDPSIWTIEIQHGDGTNDGGTELWKVRCHPQLQVYAIEWQGDEYSNDSWIDRSADNLLTVVVDYKGDWPMEIGVVYEPFRLDE